MNAGIIVINLDRSTERLAHVQAQLDARGLAFERLSATDALTLTDAERDRHFSAEVNRRRYYKALSPGEIACYISHVRAWRRIVELGWDHGIVLEDDVTLDDRFPRAVAQLPAIQANWDVIKLGSSSRKPLIARRPLADGFHLCAYAKIPISMPAQAVSRRGAEKLLARLVPFGRPVDVDLQAPWEADLDIFGIEPFAAHAKDDLDSEIWRLNKRSEFAKNRRRFYAHRFDFAWRSLRRNLARHGLAATLHASLFGGIPHP